MKAVIMAAGKGSRLGEYTADLPKSLLPLNSANLTLLDYNLNILKEIGISKILIVTGFNSQVIENHVRKNPHTEIIFNPFWNHCNVLGSLYMALDKIEDDFLFLHADTLAVKPIWDLLMKAEGDMVLPFQRKACQEEEMKVRLEGDRIVAISKEIKPEQAQGEFLGIARFARKTQPYFKARAEAHFKSGSLNQYMESVLADAIEDEAFEIKAMDILHHNFVEVDFEEDYMRARAEFGNI